MYIHTRLPSVHRRHTPVVHGLMEDGKNEFLFLSAVDSEHGGSSNNNNTVGRDTPPPVTTPMDVYFKSKRRT